MNKHEAREVLLRYRPGTPDERDPQVREALQLANHDPELAAWLANHQQFQQTLRTAMQAVPVEAGLREQILSERPARLNPPPHIPRRTMMTAVAVGVLTLTVAGLFSWLKHEDPEAQFSTYRSRMVRMAARGYSMDLETNSSSAIRSHLMNQRAPDDWQLSGNLEREPLLGCAVVPWRGQPATLICFGAQGEPDLWLFIVDGNAVPKAPREGQPEYETVNRMSTLSWSQAGRIFLLMGHQTEDELRKLAGLEG